jgi:hypothetical protein
MKNLVHFCAHVQNKSLKNYRSEEIVTEENETRVLGPVNIYVNVNVFKITNNK